MNSTYFQNYLVVMTFITVFVCALLAHTGIVLVGVLGGWVLSNIISRLAMKKWWNGEISGMIPAWKKWLISGSVSLVASQIGWVALTI